MEGERHLPGDIVDMILGFLPIEQAARMAVLSTFWRDMWFSLTRLNFDSRFFFHIWRKYSHACSDIRTQTTQEQKKDSDIWMSAALYVINKVLNQHNGLICKFVIDFQEAYYCRKTLRSWSFHLDQWFLFVTRKGVEEIHLSLMDEDEYGLPNCIFSCRTLRRLHLYGVSFTNINAYFTLPNVTSLCFHNVNFDGVDLPVPVDFPMLENLSFTRCDNLSNLNITAQKVHSLTINSRGLYPLPIMSDFRSIRTLNVDSYALKDFVEQYIGRGLQPQPLALNVEYLIVTDDHYFSSDISSEFFHLLRICPKLCELDIDLSNFANLAWWKCFGSESKHSEEFYSVAQTLKMHSLKFSSFADWETDDMFTILPLLGVFSHSPKLEKVVIIPDSTIKYNYVLKFIEEFSHFPRASTKALVLRQKRESYNTENPIVFSLK